MLVQKLHHVVNSLDAFVLWPIARLVLAVPDRLFEIVYYRAMYELHVEGSERAEQVIT